MDLSRYRMNWNYPTAVRVGAGRIAELPASCRQLGMRVPLLVTDPGIAALPMVLGTFEKKIPADLLAKVRATEKAILEGKFAVKVDDGQPKGSAK